MKFAWMFVLGTALFAQQRPNPAGFGSVLYPGTGGPPPASAHGGSGSVLYPGTGGPPGRNLITPRGPLVPVAPAHSNHGRAVIVPVPVYYYAPYNYDYSQNQAPSYTYQEPDQSPVVIMNPTYGNDAPVQVYRAPSYREEAPVEVRPDAPPTIYLLAMTDQTILPAIAYWVDGDTVSYITPEGNQNRVSLSLIDRDFSKKLNDDRHVEFKLPKQ